MQLDVVKKQSKKARRGKASAPEGKAEPAKTSSTSDTSAFVEDASVARPVLRGVSLELRPGELLGVVGPTGRAPPVPRTPYVLLLLHAPPCCVRNEPLSRVA